MPIDVRATERAKKRYIMNLAAPLVVRVTGANINRRTVANANRSGLAIEKVTDLAGDIVKLVEARKPPQARVGAASGRSQARSSSAGERRYRP